MPSDTYNSAKFTGQYRHGVDPKNRITIPADWRSGEEGVLYVSLHSTGSHVIVRTPGELDRAVAEIESLSDVAFPTRQIWIRKVTAGAQRCCVDKQGRMVLPPEFCAKAGLQGEVTLAGVMGQFQIWNSQRWEAQQAAEATDTQEFATRLGL